MITFLPFNFETVFCASFSELGASHYNQGMYHALGQCPSGRAVQVDPGLKATVGFHNFDCEKMITMLST